MWWLVFWLVEVCAAPYLLLWRAAVALGLASKVSDQEASSLRSLVTPTLSSRFDSKDGRPQRIGFVIAHPDDEAMFFSPTIRTLADVLNKQKESEGTVGLCLLCLSTGNFDGLGDIRKKELFESCARLGIGREKVTIVDDKEIQDDPTREWPYDRVISHIERFVREYNVTTLITFDERGISSHPNHISVYQAVKLLLRDHDSLRGYALITHSLVRKYLGLIDAWLLTPLSERLTSNNKRLLFYTPRLTTARDAMMAHRSQLVWFRHLFIAFSTYTFVNILRPIQ